MYFLISYRGLFSKLCMLSANRLTAHIKTKNGME